MSTAFQVAYKNKKSMALKIHFQMVLILDFLGNCRKIISHNDIENSDMPTTEGIPIYLLRPYFDKGYCLEYPESLHLCNIYFLDISFAEFLCR